MTKARGALVIAINSRINAVGQYQPLVCEPFTICLVARLWALFSAAESMKSLVTTAVVKSPVAEQCRQLSALASLAAAVAGASVGRAAEAAIGADYS